MCADEEFDVNLPKNQILKEVVRLDGIDEQRSDREFFQFLKDHKIKYTTTQTTLLRNTLGTISEDAPTVTKNPLKTDSEIVADSNLNDTEKIPQKQDIDGRYL